MSEVHRPRTHRELHGMLAHAQGAAVLLAGGTDLVLRLATGEPRALIDLSSMAGLDTIAAIDGWLEIGATATFARLAMDPLVASAARCLASAARRVGSAQIRNVATLGGNVANASPCADGTAALLALGARARILSASGVVEERTLESLLLGAGQIALGRDEALLGLRCPIADARTCSAFAKVGVRTSVAVSRLNAAFVIRLDAAGRSIEAARTAFGAIAPTAIVEEPIAAALIGHRLDGPTGLALADACARLVARRIPGRESLAYKQQAVRGLAMDLWAALCQGANVAPA